MNNMNFRSTMPTNRQVKQDTSKFTPDDWIRYIDPLVTYALRETTQGMNTERSYQKFILLGVIGGYSYWNPGCSIASKGNVEVVWMFWLVRFIKYYQYIYIKL